jgi:hypothetical protein
LKLPEDIFFYGGITMKNLFPKLRHSAPMPAKRLLSLALAPALLLSRAASFSAPGEAGPAGAPVYGRVYRPGRCSGDVIFYKYADGAALVRFDGDPAEAPGDAPAETPEDATPGTGTETEPGAPDGAAPSPAEAETAAEVENGAELPAGAGDSGHGNDSGGTDDGDGGGAPLPEIALPGGTEYSETENGNYAIVDKTGHAIGLLVPEEIGGYTLIGENNTPLGRWNFSEEEDIWIFDEFPPSPAGAYLLALAYSLLLGTVLLVLLPREGGRGLTGALRRAARARRNS